MLPAGSIPLSALATITASRIVSTTAGGVLQANAALTSGALVRANGTGSLADNAGVINTDVSAAAAIAYSKLNLATSIVNADVAAAAAIAVSKLAAQTASRAAAFDASGFLTPSALTSAQLAAAACAVTDTGRIDLTLSANSLSADLVAGGIRTVDLGAQQVGYVDCGAYATGSVSYGTSYTDVAGHGYTPRKSTSRILVLAYNLHVHSSGTTTLAIRRGTTVISTEPTFTGTTMMVIAAVDTGHGGTAQTWYISGKNTTPAGAGIDAQVALFDIV